MSRGKFETVFANKWVLIFKLLISSCNSRIRSFSSAGTNKPCFAILYNSVSGKSERIRGNKIWIELTEKLCTIPCISVSATFSRKSCHINKIIFNTCFIQLPAFRLSAGRSDNCFIRHKVRIPHVKVPPFLCAGAVKSCGFDTRSYSGSVRTFSRFPVVCNLRKSKGKWFPGSSPAEITGRRQAPHWWG